jgi:hypothetical protein
MSSNLNNNHRDNLRSDGMGKKESGKEENMKKLLLGAVFLALAVGVGVPIQGQAVVYYGATMPQPPLMALQYS